MAGVVHLTSKGKLVWQRDLRIRGGVKEYVGARVALMDDGRVVAHVFDYYHPGGYPASRIVMHGRDGKTLWEHRLGGKGGPGTPLPDTYDVRDGNIVMTGRFYRARNAEVPWRKVLSAEGKVVSEMIGQ